MDSEHNLLRNAGGSTRPGYFPAARLDRVSALFTQHHEALHHSFNCLTTLGNAVNLLTQLAIKCPGQIGGTARETATQWSHAQVNLLEGLINYVAYKRTARRLDMNGLSLLQEVVLQGVTGRLWSRWWSRYEQLPVSDLSKDALALHVGIFTLNIPLYEMLGDLDRISMATAAISEDLITSRLVTLEEALLSTGGLTSLKAWDDGVQQLALAGLPDEDMQRTEANAIDTMFRRLLPQYASVPRHLVPDSVALANIWNHQLAKKGLSDRCVIDITNVGYIDAVKDVVIEPPALAGTVSACDNPEKILSMLDDDRDLQGLAIVHRDTTPFRLSRKYGRILTPGDTYIRVSVAQVTSNCDRFALAPMGWFVILRPSEVATWLSALAHKRLVIMPSRAGTVEVSELARHRPGQPDRFWHVHWGVPFSKAASEVCRDAIKVQWTHVVELIVSKAIFWLVRRDDRDWTDIYPIAWDLLEEVSQTSRKLPGHTLSAHDAQTVFAATAMLTSVAF